MEDRIRQAVKDALATLGAEGIAFAVEWPGDLAHGDFATNAALAAAKPLGKAPREIADALVPLIRDALGDIASSVEAAGPGFVNITLAPESIAAVVGIAANEPGVWGMGDANAGKRVMVEYTDPNPFKEMHIGHLMSNVIGESIARLVEFSGATTMRANYEGDVGPHVAKAIWGLQKKGITEPATAEELGHAYAQGSRAYDESPEVKGEVDAINRAIYEGTDHELMELWRKGRDVSLAAFEELYRTLGTTFDYYFFESETSKPGLDIVREHTPAVFEESEGAVIYKGEKKGLHTLVFITSYGTPTYEAKDIGLAFLKEERWPSDISIIITAAEQIGHFKVMFAALEEVAPALAAKTAHVPHGFLRLASGKMSSREGTIITAASLINDVVAKTSERNEDPLIAEQVALAAIKYSILKQSAGSDIIFDFDQSLSLEGDSGPYLQYALVRAASIIATAGDKEVSDAPEKPFDIERLITRFPEVAARAERERAPHHVAQYLTQLASEWNSFYAKERIIDGEHEAYKLRLAKAFVATMRNGLGLLGIPVPERM
ncbi:MAG: arginine--tRNA ligase [Patescibacteria group bacterium]